MAKHEFGIMERSPRPGERYDDYEPQKYAYISVDDDWIEPILPDLSGLDFFWHTLDIPGKGLDYSGITLIPPDTLLSMAEKLDKKPGLCDLKNLLLTAKSKNKFVIHFGI